MPFEKGNTLGSREGRPKGSKNKMSGRLIEELLAAMNKVEGNKKISRGKSFFEHIVERAYRSDPTAINLLKKLVPDKHFEEIITEVKPVVFEHVFSTHTLCEELVFEVREELLEILEQSRAGILTPAETLKEIQDTMLEGARQREAERIEAVGPPQGQLEEISGDDEGEE